MPETMNLPYQEASTVVEDRIAEFLLRQKDSVKTTDLSAAVDAPGLNARVIREILSHSPRFVSVNRKWDMAIRHTLGQAPLDRAVDSVLIAYGIPLTARQIASELSLILGRTDGYYEEILPRFLRDRERYVSLSDGRLARQEWLLKVGENPTEDDVIFDNFLLSPEEDALQQLQDRARGFAWTQGELPAAAIRFVNSLEEPITNRLLSYFAWQAVPESFDSGALFESLEKRAGGQLLSGCRWCPVSLRDRFDDVYSELASRDSVPDEQPTEEQPVIRDERPIELGQDDLETAYSLIAGSDRSWRVAELAEAGFDVTEGDRGYDEITQQLNRLMVDDERFFWVGADRWRESGSLPDYVYDVPEPLQIQNYIFEDENEEPIDFEMEDKGIDDALLNAMRSPMVQDFGDREEPETLGEELSGADFWLLRHHRETGTLPVLPVFRGLFPPAPDIVEVMLTTSGGQRFPVWLNDTLETLFGLGRWYVEEDLPLSGAKFRIVRTRVPSEFRVEYAGETEPSLTIDDDRMEELELLKLEAEGETPIPTFDILRRVMERYRNTGAPFSRIWAETNVVRRTTRRMIASLLSAYQCFVPVTRGSEVWAYDGKRMPQGVNKQKKKFIRTIE